MEGAAATNAFLLKCMGHPELRTSAGAIVHIPVRKHLALLVYLAVEPRIPHPRDRLVALLWPRASDAEGRHSLATALSVVRKALGPDCFEADRDRVRLANAVIHLDVADLRPEEGTHGTPRVVLRPFLDGFDVGYAPDFELWVESQRLRWTPLIGKTLTKRMAVAKTRGDVEALERLADQFMALDPLNEDAVLGKMEARALAGDRISALRTFKRWREQLSSELGAYPSRRISELAERLREKTSDSIQLPRHDNETRRPAGATPLLGRSGELETLHAHWGGALSGSPQVVLVLGPEGSGKTALLDWFASAVAIHGSAVCRTQIHDLDRSVPAAVLAEVIRGLVQLPGAVGAAPENLAVLGSTSPHARSLFRSTGDAELRRSPIDLAEALLDLMSSVAVELPLLLVLDDAGDADDFSLTVLHMAMRKAKGQRVMLAAAVREPLPPNRRALSSILAHQVGVDGAGIRLLPLGDDDIRTILDRAAPELRHDRVARSAILRASQGNPGQAVSLVMDWRANGRSCSALVLGGMAIPVGARRDHSGGQGLSQVRLLRGLSTKARRVAQAAAVLDRHLEDLSAYSQLGLPFTDIAAAMDELQGRGLIRECVNGLRFSSAVCRAHLYLACPKPTREMLHRLVADRLISMQAASNTPATGIEIAWHLLRCGDPLLASRYLLSGVREALSAGASTEAETALHTALDWLPPEAHAECSLLLAELLQEQGRWTESLQILGSAALGEHSHAQALLTLAQERSSPPDAERTGRAIWKTLGLMDQAADPVGLARLAWTAASLANDLRSSQVAADVLTHLERVSPERLSRERLGQFALATALMLYQTRHRNQSFRQVESMVARLDHASTANTTISKLHAGLGAILCGKGAYDEAIPHLERAYAMSRRAENLWVCGAHAANIAVCLARIGDHTRQLEWSLVAKSDLGESMPTYVDVQTAYCEGLAHACLANLSAAREAVDRPRFGSGRDLPPWALQAWGFYRADVLYMIGERRAATAAAYYTLRENDYTLLSDAFAGPYARWLARTARTAAHAEAAWGRLERVARVSAQLDALDQAEVACARLDLARRRGAPEDAEARADLRRALGALPPAVARHLAALGFATE